MAARIGREWHFKLLIPVDESHLVHELLNQSKGIREKHHTQSFQESKPRCFPSLSFKELSKSKYNGIRVPAANYEVEMSGI
jgi:hypothetical protein